LITGVLLVLQAFGFSISGVLAFGGIGGIAIGFAARDLLANFFGAMVVFLDRPFSVGDWVRSPDREIEGTVEEIGWRLTRIRTFDKRPLYIPNAIFTSIVVENPSRMLNRRIYETIGIRYDDIGVMQPIVADVKAMLKSHEAIDNEVTLMVNFVEFGPSSLDFFVYCFTKTTVWAEFHEIKQDVLLKIAAIIELYGAEIAFPTQTLHLAAEPEALTAEAATD
jgi:MscS family membrane protein